MSHLIKRGQEYERHNRAQLTVTRIRIIGDTVPWWDNSGKVQVATLIDGGREIRPRYIAVRQLHNNPQRRTGYRLVTAADGTEAEGAQQ